MSKKRRTARPSRTSSSTAPAPRRQAPAQSLPAFLAEQDRLIAQARAAALYRPKGFMALTVLVYDDANPWRVTLVRADSIFALEAMEHHESESNYPYSPRLRARTSVRDAANRVVECAETVDEIANLLGCDWFASAERSGFLRLEHPLSTPERPVECYTSPTSSVRIADALRDVPQRVPETPEATIEFSNGRTILHRGTARELFAMYAAATGSFCVNPRSAAPAAIEEQAGAAPIPHPAMESCQEDGPVAAQPVSAQPVDAAEPAAAEGTDTGAQPKGAIEAGVPAVVHATGQRVNVLRTATDSGGRGYAECELLDDAGVAVDVNEFFVDELDPAPAADAQPPAHTAADAA